MRETLRYRSSELSFPVSVLGLPEAAVLMLITDEAEPHFILTQRAKHLNKHAGEVAFPGGKREAQDTDLWMTALRESAEEIQLDIQQVERLGNLPTLISRFGLAVTPYIGFVPSGIQLLANPDELDSIFRVPLKFFCEQAPQSYTVIQLAGQEYRTPRYAFEGYDIWGLTAYMIVTLMNKVFDAEIPITLYPAVG